MSNIATSHTEQLRRRLHDQQEQGAELQRQLDAEHDEVVERDLQTLLKMAEAMLTSLADEGVYPESELYEDSSLGQVWWKRLNEIKARHATNAEEPAL